MPTGECEARSDVIRARRQELGLTQSYLAARCGVGLRTLTKLEAGGGRFALDTLRRVARGLGLPLVMVMKE